MQSILHKAVLAILLSLGSLSCVGQPYVIRSQDYDFRTEDYDWSWVVGSSPNQFGLLGYRYWAHSDGQRIPVWYMTGSEGRMVFSKENPVFEHRRTRVLLGPLHFSVPLPKVAVAIIGGIIVLAFVFLFVMVGHRGRHRTRHGPPLSGAVLALLLSFGSLSCLGQSNVYEVYSCGVYSDAGWFVGSPPYGFGLQGEHYWADSAGRVMQLISVTNSSGQMILEREAGGVERRHTRVHLGPLSFSVPLPKVAVAIIGCVVVLALSFLFAVVGHRGRHRTRHERAG